MASIVEIPIEQTYEYSIIKSINNTTTIDSFKKFWNENQTQLNANTTLYAMINIYPILSNFVNLRISIEQILQHIKQIDYSEALLILSIFSFLLQKNINVL